MLIGSVFSEARKSNPNIRKYSHVIYSIGSWRIKKRGLKTYAGARVVFRKVDLQTWHWMSFADSFYSFVERLVSTNTSTISTEEGRRQYLRLSVDSLPALHLSHCARASMRLLLPIDWSQISFLMLLLLPFP